MSKKPSYSVVPDGNGGFLAMRLHAIASFLEEELATEFAKMKNGGKTEGAYSVSGVDNDFYVLREEQIALFQNESFANEYVAMKEARVMPAVHVVSSPPPQPIDHAWALAEAERMISASR
jgi:hypothetical protein